MGLLAKVTTARVTQAVTLPAPPWLIQPDGEGLMTSPELLAAACMRAVCACDAGRAESPVTSGSSLRSLLQARLAGPAVRVGCGAVSPAGAFVADWEMLVRLADDGNVMIEVPRWRTRDSKIINGDLLVAVRDGIGQALADAGPVVRADGAPDPGQLMRASVLRGESLLSMDRSPFAGDKFLPVPAPYRDRPRIDLPAGGAAAVAAALQLSQYPSRPGHGSCLASADLSGGRSSISAEIAVVADSDGDRIEIRNGDAASAAGAQRTFGAAVMILRRVADLARKGAPEAAQAVAEWVDACIQPYTSAGTLGQALPRWDKNTPVDVLPAGAGLPVALAVRTSMGSRFDWLYAAQAWLQVQQRGYVTRTGGKRVTTYVSRRSAFHKKADGTLVGKLRYMSFHGGTRPDQYGADSGSGDSCVFWECRLRPMPGGGGAGLIVDAISQTDGIVGYGGELVTLIRAFCWSVASADPQAQFTTLQIRQ